VLLFGEVVKILYAPLIFLFHDGSGSFRECLQFFDDSLVNFQCGCSLKGIAGTVVISQFYFEFADLVKGLSGGFAGAVELDGLLVGENGFIIVLHFGEGDTLEEVGFRVIGRAVDEPVEI
jgi:hypothetical protein